jgi:hypothetical protein
MADALANVIAVFPSTDSARWIVARLSFRFFLGVLAVWPRTAGKTDARCERRPTLQSIPVCNDGLGSFAS